MSNPTEKYGNSLTQSNLENESRKLKPLKVTLIVEHRPNHWDGSAITELASLFAPNEVELSIIHAMTNLLDGLPKRYNESAVLEQCLEDGNRRQDESKANLRRDLQVAGFNIQQEDSFALTNDSQEAILRLLRETGQELMILCGSHAPGAQMGRNHFFMNLTSHSPISTLMLKRHIHRKGGLCRALFGIDTSDATLTAARKLSRLLDPQQISITLATVQSPVYQENAVLAPYVNQDILTEALEANAGMTFEMITDILNPAGFKVQDMKVLIGSPATELGYIAETDNPDLVVVGSHNHKGFLAWVMGSVSSQLMHWDTHNILVVR